MGGGSCLGGPPFSLMLGRRLADFEAERGIIEDVHFTCPGTDPLGLRVFTAAAATAVPCVPWGSMVSPRAPTPNSNQDWPVLRLHRNRSRPRRRRCGQRRTTVAAACAA